MRILKDLYRICGSMYGSHQNIYAVRSGDSLTLIDTGRNQYDFDVTDKVLRDFGLENLRVSHVLITHCHYEHCANANLFKKRGAKLIIGKDDAEGLETGNDKTASYAFVHDAEFIPCGADQKVRDGDSLEINGLVWRCIHTPGHSAGSFSFQTTLEGLQILFTGDTVLTSPISVHSALGWTGGIDFDREAYLSSLEKLTHVPADLLLPGHSEICMKNGRQILLEAYQLARLKLFRETDKAWGVSDQWKF